MVYAHVYHDEDECHLVCDAVSSNGKVATIVDHTVVDENDNDASANVHGERRETNGYDVANDGRIWAEGASLEMKQLLGA